MFGVVINNKHGEINDLMVLEDSNIETVYKKALKHAPHFDVITKKTPH